MMTTGSRQPTRRPTQEEGAGARRTTERKGAESEERARRGGCVCCGTEADSLRIYGGMGAGRHRRGAMPRPLFPLLALTQERQGWRRQACVRQALLCVRGCARARVCVWTGGRGSGISSKTGGAGARRDRTRKGKCVFGKGRPPRPPGARRPARLETPARRRLRGARKKAAMKMALGRAQQQESNLIGGGGPSQGGATISACAGGTRMREQWAVENWVGGWWWRRGWAYPGCRLRRLESPPGQQKKSARGVVVVGGGEGRGTCFCRSAVRQRRGGV